MMNDDLDTRDDETVDQPREPRYYTVRVYLQDRNYGGPEEGGWYFTSGDFDAAFGYLTRSFKTRGEAVKYADFLHADLLDGINKHRPSISSVLSQGRYAAEVWDEEAPLCYPTFKPHYE